MLKWETFTYEHITSVIIIIIIHIYVQYNDCVFLFSQKAEIKPLKV